jgi:drug/metabolite transporter (DMT)-like permease
VYALLWQKLIKTIPLTVAFSNKGIVIAWNIIWGFFLFQEKIKPTMIIGFFCICAGIYIIGYSNGGNSI